MNSLEFFRTGDVALSADDSGLITLYNTTEARSPFLPCSLSSITTQINCRKFGASNVKFTHHNNGILVASSLLNKFDSMASLAPHNIDSIRYLSMHDHTYLMAFHGHTDMYERSPQFI